MQWMNGDPATAERVQGFILITLGKRYPKEIHPLMRRKHFKDSLVVHEDTGVPVTSLAEYAPEAWIENVVKKVHPIEAIAGTF